MSAAPACMLLVPPAPLAPAMAANEERRKLPGGMESTRTSAEEGTISVITSEDECAAGGDDVGRFRLSSETRAVVRTLTCERKPLGEGFALWRSIGRPELQDLDPFLSFDEFELSPPAGFPDHPHRGFETVTYMLEGGFSYHDFSGHKGTINTGDVQWMTAGRGVVHAEMPGGQGVQRGINLWINLSSKDKMYILLYLGGAEVPGAGQPRHPHRRQGRRIREGHRRRMPRRALPAQAPHPGAVPGRHPAARREPAPARPARMERVRVRHRRRGRLRQRHRLRLLAHPRRVWRRW
ncbi:uncharacterized protein LOC133899304 isoform X2 [Phragmites australis]|uniref:uncharacterized protein LOC133899304 isoform X2 n=1 Tax=Phragmites australis TaxID=29695 RepID=UPI002D765DD2|nr:uncharacterized protein LOC133899304 isoform X2 [Phragmites australis]